LWNDGLEEEQAAYCWVLNVLKDIESLDSYTTKVCQYLNSKYNINSYTYSSNSDYFKINYNKKEIWNSKIIFGYQSPNYFIGLKDLIITQERFMKLKYITENEE